MSDARRAVLQETLEADRRLTRALRHAALPTWLGLDLSMSQIKCLLVLANREALSVSGLAMIIGTSRPMASILVDQLVRLGLVTRREDPGDRRRCRVRITDEGRTLLGRLGQDDGGLLWLWCSRLPDAELLALARGLRALAAAVTE